MGGVEWSGDECEGDYVECRSSGGVSEDVYLYKWRRGVVTIRGAPLSAEQTLPQLPLDYLNRGWPLSKQKGTINPLPH